jgi:hypothetical protein
MPVQQPVQAAEPIRHITIQLPPSPDFNTPSAPPLKGGMKADSTGVGREEETNRIGTSIPGSHVVYVLARDSEKGDETPVFPLQNATSDAVMVFTRRESAVLYLQVAGWEDYKLRELSSLELGQWALSLQGDHVGFMLIDANRHDQTEGKEPLRAIALGEMRNLSGENLYEQMLDGEMR